MRELPTRPRHRAGPISYLRIHRGRQHGSCHGFSHICLLIRVVQRQQITSALLDLLCCGEKLKPLCLCINNTPPCLIHLHEGEQVTHKGKKTKKTRRTRSSSLEKEQKRSHSQPSTWTAQALLNVLSLFRRSPPRCVHSSPKNASTVATKPRDRPIIRSPLTAWTYANDRQTHAHLTHKFS